MPRGWTVMFVLIAVRGAVDAAPAFRDLALDVREALELARIPLSAAAIDMGIKHPQLTKQLNGEGHLSMRRLANLPASFWQWFAIVRARRLGVPVEVSIGRLVQDTLHQGAA